MDLPIGDFLGIAIVGAVLSLAIQWIKTKFPAQGSLKMKGITLVLSIVIGLFYFALRQTSWWEPIIGVLGAASTVYAFFLSKSSGDAEAKK